MNYYDLKKQCQPGPVLLGHGFLYSAETGACVAECEDTEQLLISHCRNNFDKALEALKQIHDATMFDEDACDRIEQRIPQGLSSLIAELEEVK